MTRTSSFPSNRERGMIGFAVLLLAGVVIMIFTMSFFVSWANYQSSLAFDSYHSQQAEMAGLQQVVQESILALRSTEPVNSQNQINTEITNRLQALAFTPGVSISLTNATTPPAHIFYPFGPATTASTLPMFSSSTVQPGIAGTGNRALAFLTRGPAADLGADPAGVAPYAYSTYTFSRMASNSPAENRAITVTARLFSVPVTNIDCIAYGLPSTGSVAPSGPMMPSGFFASGISRLVTTLNDPTKDPTFYPDLYDPNNPSSLGYQYENSVLFSWDAYEFICGNTYQDALLAAAGPTGTFDFDAPANPPIAGVTSSGNSVSCGRLFFCCVISAQLRRCDLSARHRPSPNLRRTPSAGTAALHFIVPIGRSGWQLPSLPMIPPAVSVSTISLPRRGSSHSRACKPWWHRVTRSPICFSGANPAGWSQLQ
jgi:hypothetical protein